MTEPLPPRGSRRAWVGLAVVGLVSAILTGAVFALLLNVVERKREERTAFTRVVDVTNETMEASVWGQNFPRQYATYLQTVDHERTKHGGSEAMPRQKLEQYPWLKRMFAGYAFSIDHREARGHAYMLQDQDATERVKKPQPGACLHCHTSVLAAYRHVGGGDIEVGFERVNAMPWAEARALVDDEGRALVAHPVGCVDCHDADTMALRVTRPAAVRAIRAYKASEGVHDFDVNRDATRQQMRTFVCAQCHVEYAFIGEKNALTYPWEGGLKVEQLEARLDELGHTDWTHAISGARVLKAQHPEFELYMQGPHARAGVACADCHMPYRRDGALKFSDHHVRSPLLDVNAACRTCHHVDESELLSRAHATQDRTVALVDRAQSALMDMLDAFETAKASGVDDALLEPARALHRRAQFRLDFVFSENSHGFHAPAEAARILAEAIDDARQAELELTRLDSVRGPSAPPSP